MSVREEGRGCASVTDVVTGEAVGGFSLDKPRWSWCVYSGNGWRNVKVQKAPMSLWLVYHLELFC